MNNVTKAVLADKAQFQSGEQKKECPASPQELLHYLSPEIVASSDIDSDALSDVIIAALNYLRYDAKESIEKLVLQLQEVPQLRDALSEAEEKIAQASREAKMHPVVIERYLDEFPQDDVPACVLMTCKGPEIRPIVSDTPLDLRTGDRVLVDGVTGAVFAKYEAAQEHGRVDRIEEVSEDKRVVLIKHSGDSKAVYLGSDVNPEEIEEGVRVLWDETRNIVLSVLDGHQTGHDLLAPTESLTSFTINDLGSPNPALFEILETVKQTVEHPDWSNQLRVTNRRSYLFWGPTGTGKSSSIKACVNMIADWVEEKTGKREPRVVFADASDFYSPWFGESEQKVRTWFDKIYSLASEELRAKDGSNIKLPLVVVLEEIEGLIRRRGSVEGASHLFERVLGMILQKMESSERDSDLPIVFICTTNCKHMVDAAASRRFGDREVYFGFLDRPSAELVIEKKIPDDMPCKGKAAAVRKQVLKFLYEGKDQGFAKVDLRGGDAFEINRSDVVSGALIQSAVEHAKDIAMSRSREAGKLVGIEADSVIGSLRERFIERSKSLTADVVLEIAPHKFDSADGTKSIVRVRSIVGAK